MEAPPSTPDDLLSATDIGAMFAQSATFIILWVSINHHVSQYGPLPHAFTCLKINDRTYALASLVLLILIILAHQDPYHYEDLARTAYHYSKFYDYIYVLSVRASGGEIGLHFGVHHLTTPYLTFFRVMRHSQGWVVFAALNAFHHVLMYAYFGGLGIVRPILPWTGGLQLVVGILREILLSTYFVLFVRDLRLEWRMVKRAKKDSIVS
ncbi:hypothetical protein VTO42DRAFT_6580 [Malbranchea cinnamomea]